MPIHTQSQQRHHAARRGLRIVKYRETSRRFHEYGPFAVVDRDSNCIIAARLDLDDLEAHLYG